MEHFLQFFILIPLIGFLASLIIPRKNEKGISLIAISTASIQLLYALSFFIYWLTNGHIVLDNKVLVIYHSQSAEFFLDLFFDKVTAVYLITGSFLALLVTVFSKYYIHRESGFKRFFNTLLFFFLGYNLVISGGNFETLFIGWEFLGISSFLLIAFYRDRYLPVKNGFKVFTVYRLSDICLILAIWLNHHLWSEGFTFSNFNDSVLMNNLFQNHQIQVISISLLIFIAACVKSAQLPFSSWLPRAMEGPTSSSAIFYGSLSVHLGAFILLRTYPLWESLVFIKLIIICGGAITGFVATSIARVQPTVKTQIAYASVAQIGLIFIEIALGLHTLALIHFSGNALLRTYQLLVSPSVLNYLIHHQFFNFSKPELKKETGIIKKLKNTIYVLGVKEWNLDSFMFRYLWMPLKKTGNLFSFINVRITLFLLVPAYGVSLIYLMCYPDFSEKTSSYLSLLFAALALIMALRSFTERKNALFSWLLLFLNSLWINLSVSVNNDYSLSESSLYLAGILLSAFVGVICLNKMRKLEAPALDRFHGHSYEYPITAFVFLLSCLGISGFPVTTAFIGQDIIFAHISEHQIPLVLITSLAVLICGIASIRIYARVFLGQHVKNYHEIAFKSS